MCVGRTLLSAAFDFAVVLVLAGCRVPHPCAFCAQGWDSREASRMGFVLHVILGGAAPGAPRLAVFETWDAASVSLLESDARPFFITNNLCTPSQTPNPNCATMSLIRSSEELCP
jgi:hypothetical protein